MVFFLNLLYNIYLVFFVKLTVMVKKTRLNKKQIKINIKFIPNIKFKKIYLNLQCLIYNKKQSKI